MQQNAFWIAFLLEFVNQKGTEKCRGAPFLKVQRWVKNIWFRELWESPVIAVFLTLQGELRLQSPHVLHLSPWLCEKSSCLKCVESWAESQQIFPNFFTVEHSMTVNEMCRRSSCSTLNVLKNSPAPHDESTSWLALFFSCRIEVMVMWMYPWHVQMFDVWYHVGPKLGQGISVTYALKLTNRSTLKAMWSFKLQAAVRTRV